MIELRYLKVDTKWCWTNSRWLAYRQRFISV